MNHRIAPAALLLMLAGSAALGAEVYRSTAPDGSVSYSDRPQGADAQVVVAMRPTTARAPAAATTGAQQSTPEAADTAPEAPANPAPLPEGPTATELRAQRQKNCEIARERQQRYALTQRLFRTNAAGDREYLDDAAVAEARAKAAADVQDWCS